LKFSADLNSSNLIGRGDVAYDFMRRCYALTALDRRVMLEAFSSFSQYLISQ